LRTGLEEAGLKGLASVEGCGLVWVFAIAECARQFALQQEHSRELLTLLRAQVCTNGGIKGAGAFVGCCGEVHAGRGGRAAVLGDLGEDAAVLRRVGDDSNKPKVFRCRAEHGGAADVDLLDGLFEGDLVAGWKARPPIFGAAGWKTRSPIFGAAGWKARSPVFWVRPIGVLSDGAFERIEVDADQVDRLDLVLGHFRRVLGVVADTEDAAVDFRVECFDAPVEHLGKPGVVFDEGDFEPGVAERACGAPGGEQVDAVFGEGSGKLDDALFVADGEQGAADGRGVGHAGG